MPPKKTPAKRRSKTPAKRPAPRRKLPPINGAGLRFGPEARKVILTALRKGATQRLAAELAGIDPRTLKGWLARGREQLTAIAEWERDGEIGDPPPIDAYGRFVLEVAQARASADVDLVDAVTDAAINRGEWRAGLALLARRRPAEFGEHVTLGSATVDEETQERKDNADELLDRLALLARRTRGEGDASGK